MSTRIPLFSVTVRTVVPYKSSVEQTLLASDGTLELDLESRLVLASPNSIYKRPNIAIPLENVVFFVELTEAHTKAIAEKAAAKAAVAPAAVAQAANNSDRIKYVKDEFGKIIEMKG